MEERKEETMATVIKERKRYTEEEKATHLKATEGMSFSEQGAYCDKNGVSIHTLRSWRNAGNGDSTKKRGRGRPKGSTNKKTSEKVPVKKRGRPPGKTAKKRGRPPGSGKASKQEFVPVSPRRSGSTKAAIKVKLVEDFEDRLAGGAGTVPADLRDLLTAAYNAL